MINNFFYKMAYNKLLLVVILFIIRVITHNSFNVYYHYTGFHFSKCIVPLSLFHVFIVNFNFLEETSIHYDPTT